MNWGYVNKYRYIMWITFLIIPKIMLYAQNKAVYNVDNLLTTASTHFKNGHLDSALHYQYKALSYPHSLKEEATIRLALANTLIKQSKFEEAFTQSKRVLAVGEQLQDMYLIASAHNELGVYYLDKNATVQAYTHFEKALAIASETNLKADILHNLAYLSGQTNKRVEAIDYYFQALSLYRNSNQLESEAKTLSNIASMYHAIGKLDEAINYIQQSIAIREKIEDIAGLSTVYTNAAQLYIVKQEFVKARHLMEQAMKYAEIAGNPRQVAAIYQGMATLSRRTGALTDAWTWQQKAIQLFEEQQQTEILSRVYIAAAGLAGERKDTVGAKVLFEKAITLAKRMNNHQNISMVYSQMADYYKKQHDIEQAFYYYQQFITYKDSLQHKEVLTTIAEIEQRYQAAKKDQQIAQLREEQLRKALALAQQEQAIRDLRQSEELQLLQIGHQQEELLLKEAQSTSLAQQHQLALQQNIIKEQELQQQRMWKMLIALSSLMLIWLGYSYFKRYRLKKKVQYQQTLLQERNRIAQDLHDEVGSTLSAINILSHSAKNRYAKQPEQVGKQLESISENAQSMLETMNDIVWSIHPHNDELEKIIIRMREFANTVLEPKSITYSFVVQEESKLIKLQPETRRNLYLVFKEAINNAAKYSQATHVTVDIHLQDKHLLMQIEDNGKGFTPTDSSTGNGLKNIQKRAAESSGKASIKSVVGQGTTIRVMLPYA